MLVKVLAIYAITLVVAMLVALVVKGIVVVLNAVEQRSAAVAQRPSQPAVAHAEAVAAIPAGAIPADHVAAIAAAAQAVIGEHHIVHIEEPHRGTGWVAEGRHAHHASHAVEHHPRINSRAPSVRGGKR